MRRLVVTISAVLAFTAASAPALAQEGAHAWAPRTDLPHLVVDLADGNVVSEALATHPWHPASLTKMMTAWTVLKAIDAGEVTPDTRVKMTLNAALQQPSRMGFKPGTTFSLKDALAMLMVKSANDVAMAIAEEVGGSPEDFAARMNAEAAKLGMASSYFANPHGLPNPRQITNARDMVVLIRALKREYPDWNWLWETPAIATGTKRYTSFNALLTRYPGATGMKTGYVCSSGFNIAGSAKRDGRELVVVVFGRRNGRERAVDAARLLTLGFEGRDTSERNLADLATPDDPDLEPRDMRPHVCGANRVPLPAPAEDVARAAFVGPPVADRAWLEPKPKRETIPAYRIGELGFEDPWYDLSELERVGVPQLKPPLPTIDDAPLVETGRVPTFREG